jgi:hypothetical protein
VEEKCVGWNVYSYNMLVDEYEYGLFVAWWSEFKMLGKVVSDHDMFVILCCIMLLRLVTFPSHCSTLPCFLALYTQVVLTLYCLIQESKCALTVVYGT